MKKQKYVSYRRVSSSNQYKSGLGTDFQQSVINHFVGLCGGEIVKDFIEHGSGGHYLNRKELLDAIKYCNDNDCILVSAKADRLSRNVSDAIDIFRKLSGKLMLCDIPTGSEGLTIAQMVFFSDIAQRELRLISIRNLGMHKALRDRGIQHKTVHKLSNDHRKAGVESQKYARQLFYEDNKLVYFVDGLIREERTIEEVAYELNENDFRTFTGKKYTWSTARKLIMMLAEKKVRKMKEKKGEIITGKVYIPEILKPRRKGFVGHQTLKVNG